MIRNIARQGKGSLSQANIESDICILDGYLAGLLWITVGGAAKELPYAQLVANCAMSITPRRGVITKAIKLLSSIGQEEAVAFEAIMQDDRAERYLMDLTLNDVSLVSNENISEIYEKIRRSVGKETEARLKAEHAAQLAKQEDLHEQNLSALQQERKEESERFEHRLSIVESRLLETNTELLIKAGEIKSSIEEKNKLITELGNEKQKTHALLKDCLESAKTVGRIIPLLLALFLGVAFFFLQDIIANVGDDFKTWSQVALVIISTASFSVAFWDNPELIFGKWRRRVIKKVYRCVVRFRGLDSLALTR